jgi:hypothetical protein
VSQHKLANGMPDEAREGGDGRAYQLGSCSKMWCSLPAEDQSPMPRPPCPASFLPRPWPASSPIIARGRTEAAPEGEHIKGRLSVGDTHQGLGYKAGGDGRRTKLPAAVVG